MSHPGGHDALLHELFREQAGALGITGRQLRDALAGYDAHMRNGGVAGEVRTEQLLDDIASKVYALLLQRELVGFVHDNMAWLRQMFALPPGIEARLGVQPPRHVRA